ncbi:TrkH family potassium uptake protein [Luteithermobacter gelatinilyticus]|uniref:TrkH family potassium uptake protein n=1 Tax=Luteithermobacter gelatinilyticus TaxID=2582913 RepID=UPI0011065278|nr:TrkH family potassium uptake protein [Luteithermobacter gelatinilyticus]|tara:strand:+ start:81 stop:1556 length:1476 start_codon:yes stop_codon:yes gene_type:complete
MVNATGIYAQIFKPTAYVVSYFCLYLALAMLVPASVDYLNHNSDWQVFLGSSILTGVPALLMLIATRDDIPAFTLRFGFFLVNMLWLSTAVVAALPLYLSAAGLSFTDAFFEAISGLTTTGSTVLSGLDGMPPGLLLWRSLTQWLGGIGIIGIGLMLMPFLKIGGMQIFTIESSDTGNKPVPQFYKYSLWLLGIYVGLTLLCGLMFYLSGMSGFDAINHAMTTISTGGYSTHDASVGYFHSDGVLWTGCLFMVLGSLPFAVYVKALIHRDYNLMEDPQIPAFLIILGVVISATTAWHYLFTENESFFHVLSSTAFNVISIISTTGFASENYLTWGGFAVATFFVITFFGGCSGSTAGGLKVYRLLVVITAFRTSLQQLLSPNKVAIIKYGREAIDGSILYSVLVFVGAFLTTLVALTIAVSLTGLDLLTALSGALTTLTNVGPGFGPMIGPDHNFASVPDAAKWLFSLGMLLGRLEILAVVVLFTPAFWRH